MLGWTTERGLTGPYGTPPLKIKILKSGFLHAREDQKIGQIFMNLGPQMADIVLGQPKG